jgi:gamma-glutamylaminecyclotransferase
MTHLFVYGTLKRGFNNHKRLSAARFVASIQTIAGYQLYKYNGLPIMIFSGGESRVNGELYEVSRIVLEKIDKLEGHPIMYRRQTIIVGDSREAQAYIWQGDLQGAKRITSGNWQD